MKTLQIPLKKMTQVYQLKKQEEKEVKKFLAQDFNNYRNFRKYVKGELL